MRASCPDGHKKQVIGENENQMDAIETIDVRGIEVQMHYDPDPQNPLLDWDHAWHLVGGAGCDYTLDDNNRRATFDDYDGIDWIGHYRQAGDTVALLRVSDYGSQGGHIERVDSLDRCNAIATISRDTIADEWGGDRAQAYRYLDGILDELNAYYAGEVYGWTAGADACWGYVGDDTLKEMREEALDAANWQADERDRANLLHGLSAVGYGAVEA